MSRFLRSLPFSPTPTQKAVCLQYACMHACTHARKYACMKLLVLWRCYRLWQTFNAISRCRGPCAASCKASTSPAAAAGAAAALFDLLPRVCSPLCGFAALSRGYPAAEASFSFAAACVSSFHKGDVGSGKTLVAAGAFALAAAAGRQAALLAPTTALARQHQRVMGQLLCPLGYDVALLTRDAAAKEETIKAINEGRQLLVVGTHALLQRYVCFPRLGLLVIDEQHKFGVQQRSKLLMDCMQGAADQQQQQQQQQQQPQQKEEEEQQTKAPCDLLLLTATPIPRTQLMSHCGLLHVSRLQQRTGGSSACKAACVAAASPHAEGGGEGEEGEERKKKQQEAAQQQKPERRVQTQLIDRADSKALAEVYRQLERCVAAGKQAYWICPFVHEGKAGSSCRVTCPGGGRNAPARGSGERACAAAVATFEELQQQLPNINPDSAAFGLLHGRMAAKEQQEVLGRFATGRFSVLVATTVVEVGLDVRNASLIVIDSADRFGISQLHQLRGRVMRDPQQEAACFLLYNSAGKTAAAIARMQELHIHPKVCLVAACAAFCCCCLLQGLDERALARLAAAAATTDGFLISARDAAIRGTGTVFGAYQHGRTDVALFNELSFDERMQLQFAAAADAREVMRLYTAAGPIDGVSAEVKRQAAELVQQVQQLMPHPKTDWVLSA
ncbi:hypothetical protein Efla_002780 [Eimeria flavescens]